MEWDRMNDYQAEFHRIKEKYAGKIELYLGLEIDYLNEESNPSAARFRELPLDYRIGSVPVSYTHLDVYKRQVYGIHFPYAEWRFGRK